ncbi:hypothetical protein [Kallotenue papyrolyticum]|uniref:hypothetical protein n=1 Tax=Kallotenue papyrolyticum TaxID=1325125 RepID=UPI0012682668|nr:hypothetical protein [Kallotenue papyrolyticum]
MRDILAIGAVRPGFGCGSGSRADARDGVASIAPVAGEFKARITLILAARFDNHLGNDLSFGSGVGEGCIFILRCKPASAIAQTLVGLAQGGGLRGTGPGQRDAGHGAAEKHRDRGNDGYEAKRQQLDPLGHLRCSSPSWRDHVCSSKIKTGPLNPVSGGRVHD